MDVTIDPKALSGSIRAIPSKSDAHRLLICAALSDGPVRLLMDASSEDIDATVDCLKALGSVITKDSDGFTVLPIAAVPEDPLLDCRESGSTLRFLLPLAAALSPKACFTGRGRLPERPLRPLITAMEEHGVIFSQDRLPFAVTGRLKAGHYRVPGNVSSQYISGLLLALAALGGGSSVELKTQLVSSGYVKITCHALKRFQIEVVTTGRGWRIPPGQTVRSPGEIQVEGDWSNAGFFLVSGALGSDVTVKGLDPGSPQGDKLVLDVLGSFGAKVTADDHAIRVSKGHLKGRVIDCRQIPDALPILAVLAASSEGETEFINAGRLRLKESDRLSATARMIRSLGGSAKERPEGLVVQGASLKGGTVDGAGDHRIVMAAAIAATVCLRPVTIKGSEAVRKSYPHFFDDYISLGGRVHVL